MKDLGIRYQIWRDRCLSALRMWWDVGKLLFLLSAPFLLVGYVLIRDILQTGVAWPLALGVVLVALAVLVFVIFAGAVTNGELVDAEDPVIPLLVRKEPCDVVGVLSLACSAEGGEVSVEQK